MEKRGGNMHQVELSDEDIEITRHALAELERHQQGVADEVYGSTGLIPNPKLCDEYIERARAARTALAKLRKRTRR